MWCQVTTLMFNGSAGCQESPHHLAQKPELQEGAKEMPCNWSPVRWKVMPFVPMHRDHNGMLGKPSSVHTVLYVGARGRISEAAPTEPCGFVVPTGPLLSHHAG